MNTAPPPPPTPGTPEWAQWQIQHTFTDDTDRRIITDLIAVTLVPYLALSRARPIYARACMERHWQGWQARLVWAILEATVKDVDDDIPF